MFLHINISSVILELFIMSLLLKTKPLISIKTCQFGDRYHIIILSANMIFPFLSALCNYFYALLSVNMVTNNIQCIYICIYMSARRPIWVTCTWVSTRMHILSDTLVTREHYVATVNSILSLKVSLVMTSCNTLWWEYPWPTMSFIEAITTS